MDRNLIGIDLQARRRTFLTSWVANIMGIMPLMLERGMGRGVGVVLSSPSSDRRLGVRVINISVL